MNPQLRSAALTALVLTGCVSCVSTPHPESGPAPRLAGLTIPQWLDEEQRARALGEFKRCVVRQRERDKDAKAEAATVIPSPPPSAPPASEQAALDWQCAHLRTDIETPCDAFRYGSQYDRTSFYAKEELAERCRAHVSFKLNPPQKSSSGSTASTP